MSFSGRFLLYQQMYELNTKFNRRIVESSRIVDIFVFSLRFVIIFVCAFNFLWILFCESILPIWGIIMMLCLNIQL